MTKKLTTLQKDIIKQLANGAVIRAGNKLYNATGHHIDTYNALTVKAVASYLEYDMSEFLGEYRLNDAGRALAIELGYIVDDETPVEAPAPVAPYPVYYDYPELSSDWFWFNGKWSHRDDLDFGKCMLCGHKLNETIECPNCGQFHHTNSTFARMENEYRRSSIVTPADDSNIMDKKTNVVTKQEIEITVKLAYNANQSKHTVTAEVYGAFGVHREFDQHAENMQGKGWTVTHIPTGCVPTPRNAYRLKREAVAIAKALMPFATRLENHAGDKTLGSDIVKAVGEAIRETQDTPQAPVNVEETEQSIDDKFTPIVTLKTFDWNSPLIKVSNVMDKSVAVVLEETPFCDPEAWLEMVAKSMADDMLVWEYERETRKHNMPVRFEAVGKSEEYRQWEDLETTYFEITGNNYSPLVEIDFYHYLANRR